MNTFKEGNVKKMDLEKSKYRNKTKTYFILTGNPDLRSKIFTKHRI